MNGGPHRWLAVGVIVVAAVIVLSQLPTSLRAASAKRRQNDAYTSDGRVLAAADSIDVDNSFVRAALEVVPERATYVVLRPPADLVAQGKLSGVTYDALRPFLRYVLLPRREVDRVAAADYVLCYGCTARVRRVAWLWTGDEGLKIGKRR